MRSLIAKYIVQRLSSKRVRQIEIRIPYTRVNKRMRLFAKLHGNMRLIPNMRLIAKGKIDHTSKTARDAFVGSTCT